MSDIEDYDAFDLDYDENRVAWLGFDNRDSDTNVLTEFVIQALDSVIDDITDAKATALIIFSKKTNGFIAGADVKAFAKVTQEAVAESHILAVHKVFNKLEKLSIPTLAMIHGYCLGGGLELALACDYRVAQDDQSLRIGFPEVKLGIFPGYGGTVRSTAVMGDLNAMSIMLSGSLLSGRAAKKMGLIDYLVPQRQLRNATHKMLKELPQKKRAKWYQQWAKVPLLRLPAVLFFKHKVSQKVSQAHYPAPFKLIEHWENHAYSLAAMYASEAKQVANLICSETAQQLIRVYLLQTRLKSLGNKQSLDMKHVHVVGGGVMGGDIAAWCALKGFSVTLQDRAPAFLGQAIMRAHKLFKKKLKTTYAVRDAVDRLMPDHLGLGAAEADVVIEAIYEDAEAKRSLYAELESKMKPGALLGTNTSSIPLNELSTELSDKSRLVGLHFFNPVSQMPLLEIVSDSNTDANAIDKAMAFARHIGKLPLPVKSSPGFLVNRVLMPYLLEAVILVEEGIDAETIDSAATSFGMPMGPIELADTVGLDVCLSVAENLLTNLGEEVPSILKQRVESKLLGKKSGRGFYEWKDGRAVKKSSLTARQSTLSKQITDRLIMRFLNEAIACLREGVVEDVDLLDAGIIFGTGFAPFRGGPMNYIHNRTSEECVTRLQQLSTSLGQRFNADKGWLV